MILIFELIVSKYTHISKYFANVSHTTQNATLSSMLLNVFSLKTNSNENSNQKANALDAASYTMTTISLILIRT